MSTPLRAALGALALIASGLLIRAAMMRLVRGLAMLFGGATAFAVGVLLIGSVVVSMLRRWRRRRRASTLLDAEG